MRRAAKYVVPSVRADIPWRMEFPFCWRIARKQDPRLNADAEERRGASANRRCQWPRGWPERVKPASLPRMGRCSVGAARQAFLVDSVSASFFSRSKDKVLLHRG